MPNMVWSRLVVEGAEAEVGRFADFVKTDGADGARFDLHP